MSLSPPSDDWEQRSGHWFLCRVLRHLIKHFRDKISMGRFVPKDALYLTMSWWFRCSREDTMEVLTMLSKAFPGIVFSNRGLRVSSAYLDRDTWKVCDNERHPSAVLDPENEATPEEGGEPNGVAA